MNNIKGLSDKKRAEIAEISGVAAESIYRMGYADGVTASTADGTIESQGLVETLIEMASLIQRVQKHHAENDATIFGFSASEYDRSIHVKTKPFLQNFTEFEIRIRKNVKFMYELYVDISGVKLITLMDPVGIVDLRETMPEQWEYIQKKVQVEGIAS